MNKPILALFSLLFVASAFCIDISSDEEFTPASGSNNVPIATPASAFRPTRPNSIKENDSRGVHNARKLEIVDDDEDFLDNLDDDEEFLDNFNDDEEFIVKPSASVSNKKKSKKFRSSAVTNGAKDEPVTFYSVSTVAGRKKCPKDMKCKKYDIPDKCDLTCEGKINEKNRKILVEKTCANCIIKSRCDLYCVQKKDISFCDTCKKTFLYI